MAGYLTTHVLDTARGSPADGLMIELFRIDGDTHRSIKKLVTNSDGRTDEQILPEAEFELGTYELVFHCGNYLDRTGVPPKAHVFLTWFPCVWYVRACALPRTVVAIAVWLFDLPRQLGAHVGVGQCVVHPLDHELHKKGVALGS